MVLEVSNFNLLIVEKILLKEHVYFLCIQLTIKVKGFLKLQLLFKHVLNFESFLDIKRIPLQTSKCTQTEFLEKKLQKKLHFKNLYTLNKHLNYTGVLF